MIAHIFFAVKRPCEHFKAINKNFVSFALYS
jgi:hypothetical protein